RSQPTEEAPQRAVGALARKGPPAKLASFVAHHLGTRLVDPRELGPQRLKLRHGPARETLGNFSLGQHSAHGAAELEVQGTSRTEPSRPAPDFTRFDIRDALTPIDVGDPPAPPGEKQDHWLVLLRPERRWGDLPELAPVVPHHEGGIAHEDRGELQKVTPPVRSLPLHSYREDPCFFELHSRTQHVGDHCVADLWLHRGKRRHAADPLAPRVRSEERRVGKE